MNLKPSVQITLIIVMGIIALTLISIFTGSSSEIPKNSIQVNGQSKIDVTPDLMTISYNVETQGKTPKEAEDLNSEIVGKLSKQIVILGFNKEDLKTQSFNIYPEYDWESGTQKLIGYKAVHSLKMELTSDKMNRAGSLIDAGTSTGAGISYINFELSPDLEQKSKAEAIKLASQDARIKAEAIAEGFNKEVGKVVSITLSEFGYQPWILYAEEPGMEGGASFAKESVAGIQPSEQEISAFVTAVYKLR